MPIALVLAASQAAIASADVATAFDITVRQPCAPSDEVVISGEIVVCGERERQDAYRLRPVGPGVPRTLPKAEMQVAQGTSLAVETESADLGMARAQRAMVRLKFKF